MYVYGYHVRVYEDIKQHPVHVRRRPYAYMCVYVNVSYIHVNIFIYVYVYPMCVYEDIKQHPAHVRRHLEAKRSEAALLCMCMCLNTYINVSPIGISFRIWTRNAPYVFTPRGQTLGSRRFCVCVCVYICTNMCIYVHVFTPRGQTLGSNACGKR